MQEQTANLNQIQESRRAVVAAFIWIVIPLVLDAVLLMYWLGLLDA